MDYVDAVPAERVAQIHIAGHSKYEKYILDTHDHPVIDPVWELYERAIERCGSTPTLLEWDDHIPSFDEVHGEAKKAERYLKRHAGALAEAAMSRAMNLTELQREMAAAVMLPLTADEEMRARSCDGRKMSSGCGKVYCAEQPADAFERLEIYNRQYWFRVLGALAEDFTALRAVVGEQRI